VEGRLYEDLIRACGQARQHFRSADVNRDETVDRGESRQATFVPLRELFAPVDRDSDGRLRAAEWDAFLDLQLRFLEGQVVLTVLDHGPGLFEGLDADSDGRLSVRELRGAWRRLDQLGCVRNGKLVPERLPRHLRLVASRGRPPGGTFSDGSRWKS
jgi:hypothetical protein